MKTTRRQFVRNSAGLLIPGVAAGLILPRKAAGGVIGLSGGRYVPPSGLTAAEDWTNRTSAPGVVWFHDFRNDAEVNNFRWTNNTGNDPNGTGAWGVYNGNPTVYRNPSVGITGGCLELLHPAGSYGSSSWWRPLSPFNGAGNGRGVADPADGGALTVRSWSPTQGGLETQNYGNSWYMHSSFSGSIYDGTEFWMQVRCRRDAARFFGANAGVQDIGKFMYWTICRRSLSDQELVVYSGSDTFRVYGGWQIFDPLDQEDGIGGTVQPGGVSPEWVWATDGSWDTIMFHIRPGRVGIDETLFEVYGAHAGETSYTLFWQQTFAMNNYDTDIAGRGYQALIASTYQNGTSFPAAWREQWAQVIFSRQSIACPQV